MSSDSDLRHTLQIRLESLEIKERFYADAADPADFADLLVRLRAGIAALQEELRKLDDRGS